MNITNIPKRTKYAIQEQTITCNISGITTTIITPILPKLKNISYSGLHPLASLETCQELARMRYSQEHIFLSPTILAGAILSILYHLELRHDNVPAYEANAILATLPPFTLSTILAFAGTLEKRHASRIPSLSLEEREAQTLVMWHNDCEDAFASAIAERQYYQAVEVKKIQTKEQPKLIEIRKQARSILKNLQDMDALPSKLSSILTTLLQKDILLTVGQELRGKVCIALRLLDIPDSLELAGIIEDAHNLISKTDKTKASLFDNEIDRVSDMSEFKPKTLAEILAAAQQPPPQPQEKPEDIEEEQEYEAEKEEEEEEHEEYLFDDEADDSADEDFQEDMQEDTQSNDKDSI